VVEAVEVLEELAVEVLVVEVLVAWDIFQRLLFPAHNQYLVVLVVLVVLHREPLQLPLRVHRVQPLVLAHLLLQQAVVVRPVILVVQQEVSRQAQQSLVIVGFLALLAEYFQFEWVVMEVIVFKYGVLVALVVVLALLVLRG
jgi:hypothetical protein